MPREPQSKKPQLLLRLLRGGEGEIRTHGNLAATLDFESSAFDHSATSPTRPNTSLEMALGQDMKGI